MIDQYKVNQFFMVITGISLLIIGTFVFFDPIFFSRKFGVRINFGEYHRLIGVAIGAGGGIVVYGTLTAKRKSGNSN